MNEGGEGRKGKRRGRKRKREGVKKEREKEE